MLTLFACPKRFDKKIGLIQTNAISSWKCLDPHIQIILIGNDPTVKSFAIKNGLEFDGGVRVNNYGTPYVNSIFEIAEKRSKYDTLVYVNSDIIFFDDLLESIKKIERRFKKFLIAGQRYDLSINNFVNFTDTTSKHKLFKLLRIKGKKHGYTGMDYFVFKKNSLGKIPSFLIGRDGWDNWMIHNALNNRIRVLDATNTITALHQNHGYSHLTQSKKNEEDSSNDSFVNGRYATLNDADYILNNNQEIVKKTRTAKYLDRVSNTIRFNLMYLKIKFAILNKFFCKKYKS